MALLGDKAATFEPGKAILFYINTESMKFLERSLEQIIHEADKEELKKQGLFVGHKTKRQVRLGNYGIADIIGVHRFSNEWRDPDSWKTIFTICELKQHTLSISAFLQALRYAKGLQRYIKNHRKYLHNSNYDIRIVLIGKDLPNKSDLIYAPDLICNYGIESGITLELYTYEITLNGLKFHPHHGYRLENEGF